MRHFSILKAVHVFFAFWAILSRGFLVDPQGFRGLGLFLVDLPGFRVEEGLEVWGLRFGVWGLGFRV